MSPLRCLLILTLIAAASATFSFGKRVQLSRRGRCGRRCGLTTRRYNPPARGTGNCFQVYRYFADGVSDDLSVSIDIFKSYANQSPAPNIFVAMETFLHLARGCSLILDRWVQGLLQFVENLFIGFVRLVFCVNGDPWRNGNFISRWRTIKKIPPVCRGDFGVKWGWRNRRTIFNSKKILLEIHRFKNLKVNLIALLKEKLNISSIDELTGTYRVICNCLMRICGITELAVDSWKEDYYMQFCKELITLHAAILSGYKAETGPACVDESTEYLEPCIYTEYQKNVTQEWRVEIYKEIDQCTTVDYSGAVKIDVNLETNVD